MKHRLKLFVRSAWARLVYHTGLHVVLDRLMPRRLLILAGHCVAESDCNGHLPGEMKIDRARLTEVLRFFGRRYERLSVGDGWRALRSGDPRGRSIVALSMDDGYRDNASALLPLLQREGVPATVYLETRPLVERRLSWTHKYFWIVSRCEPAEVARRLAGACEGDRRAELERIAAGGRVSYHLKRVLKYDLPREVRDRVITELFVELGGDERELCERLYLSWEDARSLRDAGVELGCHTVHHEVLSRLEEEELEREVTASRDALRAELGGGDVSFAYPFGRDWDHDARVREAVRGAGFENATTTRSGTNGPEADPLRLKRWMIDDRTPLHLLATEACGGFDLLRRFGLDLSE